MKKFIGVLALFAMLFAFSGPCFATGDSAVGDVDFGVHIGTGSSNYSGSFDLLGGNIDSTFSEEHAYLGGVYLNFSGPDSCIELQPELNFIHDTFDLYNSGEVHEYDRLQLPVLLKVNSSEICGTKVFAGVGPYGSVLLSDQKHIMRRYDYGYVLSAGVTIQDTVSFEIRHTQGLNDVSNVDGVSMRNSKNFFLVGLNFQ